MTVSAKYAGPQLASWKGGNGPKAATLACAESALWPRCMMSQAPIATAVLARLCGCLLVTQHTGRDLTGPACSEAACS